MVAAFRSNLYGVRRRSRRRLFAVLPFCAVHPGVSACFFRVRAAGRAPPPASSGSFLDATAQRQLSWYLESRRQTIDLPSGQPSQGCAQTSKI